MKLYRLIKKADHTTAIEGIMLDMLCYVLHSNNLTNVWGRNEEGRYFPVDDPDAIFDFNYKVKEMDIPDDLFEEIPVVEEEIFW